MAITTKRIIQLDTANTIENADYIVVDNASDGTRKYATAGKGLSAEDYTTAEKTKLAGIAAGAEVNVQADWTEADSSDDAFIKNKPALSTVATSGSYNDLSNTPNLAAVATSGSYNDLSNTPNLATVATSGSYTDLSNKPVIDSALDGSSTNAVENKAVKGSLDTKANIDGYYENLGAGTAEQLISSVYETDKVPYNFRTSGGSADIGNRETDQIVGGTIAWNQLIPIGTDKSKTQNGVTFTDNRDGSYTIQTTAEGASADTYITIASETTSRGGHVTLLVGAPTGSSYEGYRMWDAWGGAGNEYGNGSTGKFVVGGQFEIRISVGSGTIITTPVKFTPQLFDITQMLGSAIANYFYDTLRLTSGASKAWFRNLFPKDYYAYNAGELMSVKTSAHNTVGFNALDTSNLIQVGDNNVKTDNNIKVVGGQTYEFCFGNPFSFSGIYIEEYSSTGEQLKRTAKYTSGSLITTLQANTVSVRLDVYTASGVTLASVLSAHPCFHLTWSGYRNGEYEPYVKHTYALDSDLELRGIPKLDANNKWYYDGDIYESDGTVTRKYGIVDLGTLNWFRNGSGTPAQFYATLPVYGIEDRYGKTIICTNYIGGTAYNGNVDKVACTTGSMVWITDNAYSTSATFKTAMSGVYLVYELATPTTETADAYTNPQIVNDFGTEEYVDTRAVPVPVGHDTEYMANLRDKLQHLPDLAANDGTYLITQSNKDMALSAYAAPRGVPDAPGTDGTYVLKATVSSGTATYTWVAE